MDSKGAESRIQKIAGSVQQQINPMTNKTMKIHIALLIAGISAFTINAAISEDLPKGWFHAGSHPKDYEMSVDQAVAHSGKASASLKSIVSETSGFGTLMQTFKADS